MCISQGEEKDFILDSGTRRPRESGPRPPKVAPLKGPRVAGPRVFRDSRRRAIGVQRMRPVATAP